DRGRPDSGGPVEPFQGSDCPVQLRGPHPEEGGAVVLSLRAQGSVRPRVAVPGQAGAREPGPVAGGEPAGVP
ncbi:unnamed protein product, partial [Ectocarpus fasciculatus]